MVYARTLLFVSICGLVAMGCTESGDRILGSVEQADALQLDAMPGTAAAEGRNHASGCLRERFRGITPTAADGTLLGLADRRDWGCVSSRGRSRHHGTPEAGKLEAKDIPAPPPLSLCFDPAAPNPTEGLTRLGFSLPESAPVHLVIYGQSVGGGALRVFEVKTLIEGLLVPGFHTVVWDGKDGAGQPAPPGIYRAVLTVQGNQLCGDIEVVEVLP